MLPGLGPSGIPVATLGDLAIQDIAPTICTWLGVRLEGVDGRPIPELAS